ncbi:MAG: adenylate/guanylate cyclase domain-containing protein [Phaeodactylibacter sp.]|nr:adenylate/guanylate cyclase domain-containing protein [Phaeodactylibacter sp.]
MKRQLKRVLWITVAWTFVAVLQFLMVYSTVIMFECPPTNFDLNIYFWSSVITGLNAGLLGGSMMVFGWEKWLRRKSYGVALVDLLSSFVLVYLVVGAINGIYYNAYEKDLPFFSQEVLAGAVDFLLNIGNLQSFVFWLLTVVITMVFLQVSDKYGPGVFVAFLLGKYFTPKREERIFMFLDLRSSTTIAEQLGEERYFSFIRQVFEDVTPAIINAKGQIYQYVGDEIVISWDLDEGFNNANCIQCFFNIQQTLKTRADYYEAAYDNIRPEFKAGVHYGPVMAGEVGVVKRDIAYSGDVLNTTARIQSKCNEFGVDILVSKVLFSKLNQLLDTFSPQEIGRILLRGKQENIVLYTLGA